MRIFSSIVAADDDDDVDDLATGHGATRKRHVAAAGDFLGGSLASNGRLRSADRGEAKATLASRGHRLKLALP